MQQNQLKLAPHISFTELDDEAVLLDLNSGAYYGLNHVGVALLKALENGTNQEAVIQEISSLYNTPIDQVETDVSALIRDMLDRHLLMNQ